MEKLTIEVLAHYLPYGLKINTLENVAFSIDFNSKIIESRFRGHLINIYEWDEIKPILRPLSDIKYDTGLPVAIKDYFKGQYKRVVDLPYWAIQYLLGNNPMGDNFDVFGLIDKGLAIDINSLTNK